MSSAISIILLRSPWAEVLISCSWSTCKILGAIVLQDCSLAWHIAIRILDVGCISLSSGSHKWCLHSEMIQVQFLNQHTYIKETFPLPVKIRSMHVFKTPSSFETTLNTLCRRLMQCFSTDSFPPIKISRRKECHIWGRKGCRFPGW